MSAHFVYTFLFIYQVANFWFESEDLWGLTFNFNIKVRKYGKESWDTGSCEWYIRFVFRYSGEKGAFEGSFYLGRGLVAAWWRNRGLGHFDCINSLFSSTSGYF